MLSKLHLTLLSFVPFPLLAQFTAGELSGTIHTIVEREIHPSPVPSGGESYAADSVDLNGDGVHDLIFHAGHTRYPDAINNYIAVEMGHAGVALAVSGINGHAARRLGAGTPIDAGLPTWRAYDTEAPNNTPSIGNVGASIAGGFIVGADEWLINGPVDTEGFLAVRLGEGEQIRYGWVHLISHIEQDSVRLQIIDMAIQDVSTVLEENTTLDAITAHFRSDGHMLLQGPLQHVQRITLHDAGGRLVRQVDAPVRNTIHLSDGPQGLYVLTLLGEAGRRTIKLVR